MKILGHPRLKLLSNQTRTIITAKPLESGGLSGANFSKHKRDNSGFDVEALPRPEQVLYGMSPRIIAGFDGNSRSGMPMLVFMESFNLAEEMYKRMQWSLGSEMKTSLNQRALIIQ